MLGNSTINTHRLLTGALALIPSISLSGYIVTSKAKWTN